MDGSSVAPIAEMIEPQWNPHLGRLGEADESKLRRKHADEFVALSVKRNRPAYQFGIGVEPALPQAMADYRDPRSVRFIFLRPEPAPDAELDSKNIEEVRRDHCRLQLLRFIPLQETDPAGIYYSHAFEDLVLTTDVVKVRQRELKLFTALLRHTSPEQREPIRFAERQRPQQDSLHCTQQGRCGACPHR